MNDFLELSAQQDRLIQFAINNPIFSPRVSPESIQRVTEIARDILAKHYNDPASFVSGNLIYLIPLLDDSDCEDLFHIFEKLGFSRGDSLNAMRSLAMREYASLKGQKSDYSVNEFGQILKVLHIAIVKITAFIRKFNSVDLAKNLETSPEALEILLDVKNNMKVDMRNNMVKK